MVLFSELWGLGNCGRGKASGPSLNTPPPSTISFSQVRKDGCFQHSQSMGSGIYQGRISRGVAACGQEFGFWESDCACVARCVKDSMTSSHLEWFALAGVLRLFLVLWKSEAQEVAVCVLEKRQTSRFPRTIRVWGPTVGCWVETAACNGHVGAGTAGNFSWFACLIDVSPPSSLFVLLLRKRRTWLHCLDAGVVGGVGEGVWAIQFQNNQLGTGLLYF